MPGNKKPRKKYRPKDLSRADRIASTMLPLRLASKQGLSFDQVRDMNIAAYGALDAITRGVGTEDSLHQLSFTSNVSLLLAERGLGPEFIPDVQEAQTHILGLIGRHNRKESLLLSGPGIQAVRRMLQLHDQQISNEGFTEGMAYGAVKAVLERMYAGDVLSE